MPKQDNNDALRGEVRTILYLISMGGLCHTQRSTKGEGVVRQWKIKHCASSTLPMKNSQLRCSFIVCAPFATSTVLVLFFPCPPLGPKFPIRSAYGTGATTRQPRGHALQMEGVATLAPHHGALVSGVLHPGCHTLESRLADSAYLLLVHVRVWCKERGAA